MNRAEIIDALTTSIDRKIRVTFDDGVVQSVAICTVDEEGFLHSGPDGIEPAGYWTRFEGVTLIEL
jgi:hypothetical protein